MNFHSMLKNSTSMVRSDLASLLRLSARIGRDPLLVHASSGNTSVKVNGTLWVKASGKWLANADREEILVPVDLCECLECFKEGRAFPPCEGSAHGGRLKRGHRTSIGLRANDLRPSIETFMHAVLPQRIVVHVHCVNTLAWAVRSDAPDRLRERLAGLRWQWIPYVPSGLALAREVQAASFRCPDADIFVLGNHGLVVCGDDCEAANAVLSEVQRRLYSRPRPTRKPNFGVLESVQRISKWRLPDSEALHTLGTDATSRRVIERGVLYPCQAIFLQPAVTLLAHSSNVVDATRQIEKLPLACPFLVMEGNGVLLSEEMTAAEGAVLNGLAEVVRRIESSAPIRYLTEQEVSSVLRVDGPRYRTWVANRVPRSTAQAEGHGQLASRTQ